MNKGFYRLIIFKPNHLISLHKFMFYIHIQIYILILLFFYLFKWIKSEHNFIYNTRVLARFKTTLIYFNIVHFETLILSKF